MFGGANPAKEMNPAVAAGSSAASASASFVVAQSGTAYRQATLAAQARTEADRYSPAGSAPTFAGALPTAVPSPVPSRSAPEPVPPSPYASPTALLRGCVYRLTGGTAPRLVDRGSYQGTPAYVIVGESKVWVVGLGCTASRPDLLASAALAG
jgi:hypothetical protein